MYYVFDKDVAVKYGVKEAVILSHIEFWIFTNRANGSNFHDGRHWHFSTLKAFQEIWPFWDIYQISRTLKKLVKDGVLTKGNYNKRKSDRTLWYAFKDEESWFLEREAILQKRNMDIAKVQKPFCKNAKALPNNNPNNSPDRKPKPIGSCDKESILKFDLAIVEKRKEFCRKLSETFRPTKREAKTFANITHHLVEMVQSGRAELSIFDQAIDWAQQASQARGVKNKKGLFVSMVKKKTGFKAQRLLLTG